MAVATIKRIYLQNFKRFQEYTIEPNDRINILVGDNEAGKSSVLEAIDLAAGGNVRRVEAIGIDRLLNIDAVQEFISGERKFTNLPRLVIELYLEGNFGFEMNGKNNSQGILANGIRLICEPNPDYVNEINEALEAHGEYFPYDYYHIRFSTFADEGYTGYKKKLRSVLIDSAGMSSEYATNDFVKRMYLQYTEAEVKERALHNSRYRIMRNEFQNDSLRELNDRVPAEKGYTFGLRSGSSMSVSGDLMIYESGIEIDNKGTGKQVFIKTDFALEKSGENIDVILIEEPENHLSPVNLRKLIQRVANTRQGQIFITTHNSMISTRLELQNLLIMHVNDEHRPTMLADLSVDTAKHFMKTPPAGIVEYALAPKSILVEGPAEYMLFEKFYMSVAGYAPEKDDVHIIDVRGLSFKRYLEIAKLIKSKVAVITDNDGDVQKNITKKYESFSGIDHIKVFNDGDTDKRTFEIVLYGDNEELCRRLFGDDAQQYMLNNKTEAAYELLSCEDGIIVPDYIQRAIQWIRE